MFYRSAGALCLLALLVSGCSQAPATVSGTVHFDGQPLTTGNIAFIPAGRGPVALGSIGTNGQYEIRTGTDAGLEPGEYIVTVVATKPVIASDPQGPAPLPEPITPAKYAARETTDLKCTVQAGSNTLNFELKSK